MIPYSKQSSLVYVHMVFVYLVIMSSKAQEFHCLGTQALIDTYFLSHCFSVDLCECTADSSPFHSPRECRLLNHTDGVTVTTIGHAAHHLLATDAAVHPEG